MQDPKFESRKKDHIQQSLRTENQVGLSPSSEIKIPHKAFPEINFSDVNLKVKLWDKNLNAPLFMSSMTAGHTDAESLNYNLAKACFEKNWSFSVGSQRKELAVSGSSNEWVKINTDFPDLIKIGNLGLAQLIEFGPEACLKLIDNLKASAFYIHCNPLQEVLQQEGTTEFKGGLKALKALCKLSPVPILVKETGCGFDFETLYELSKLPGLYAVDVSGFGGTHWGRIEGGRNQFSEVKDPKIENLITASQTYGNWGITTAESLADCFEIKAENSKFKYWASGGIRNGLDVVTCLSMGAEMVGLAQPIMKHILQGYDSLIQYMELIELETKIGLFCSGQIDVKSCQKEAEWEWR